jgi:hypothetical protein
MVKARCIYKHQPDRDFGMSYRDDWQRFIRDSGSSGRDDDITVFFNDIKTNLLEFIEDAECLLGCVAWLTDYDILDALRDKPAVSIIVNKTNKLRADTSLRARYRRVSAGPLTASMFDDSIYYLKNGQFNPPIDALRCVGYTDQTGYPVPLMHHKFLVSCSFEDLSDTEREWGPPSRDKKVVAREVWTGSFNFSVNASLSLENALWISRAATATRFLRLWNRIYVLSEPLDWTAVSPQPELQFDTSVYDGFESLDDDLD